MDHIMSSMQSYSCDMFSVPVHTNHKSFFPHSLYHFKPSVTSFTHHFIHWGTNEILPLLNIPGKNRTALMRSYHCWILFGKTEQHISNCYHHDSRLVLCCKIM